MNRNEKIKVISQAIYDDYIKKGWKNVSIYDCEVKAMNYVDTEIVVKKLTLTDVVNCVYVVTERDNYGEQLFKGVFANREKAVEYLAEDGLKESNIDEINEIELN